MNRIKHVAVVVALFFSTLGVGLVNLMVLHGGSYRALSQHNCIRLIAQPGARGNILDRSGEVIAESKLSYDLMLMPQEVPSLDKAFAALSRITGASASDLKKAYKKNYIGLSLPVTLLKNISRSDAVAVEELKFDLPGVMVNPRPVRAYPYGSVGCHILGYVNEIDRWRLTRLADYGYKTKDLVGFGGVEERYDYYLREEEGGTSVEVDHRGRFVQLLGVQPPRNGKDVELTIDINVEKVAEDALTGKKGCVVILDVASGEVIAMASSPGFNPSLFAERKSEVVAGLFRDSDAPLINRAISASYPAGSVFKAIDAVAGLETKKINQGTSFVCTGKTLVGKKEFNCWSTHGPQDIFAALAHSCNVFFYRTGLAVGGQMLHDYAVRFGLSRSTSFELPYETAGFIPSPLGRKINKFRNWFDGDTANLAIGQGDVLVTPLQIARMMAVFANGGNLVTPYIVKAIDGKDISAYQRKVVATGMRSDVLAVVRSGLRGVVRESSGTANVLSGLPVEVAGKTGTAQAPPGQPHGWFAGFFPYTKPRFAICVLLEHGGPGYHACLVGKQVIEGMVSSGVMENK